MPAIRSISPRLSRDSSRDALDSRIFPDRLARDLGMQIAPELLDAAVDERPVLKADALKFATLLRGQLAAPALLGVFGGLVGLLAADASVVHSYAAIAIERLLASKVRPASGF